MHGYCLDLSLHYATERWVYGGAIVNFYGARD